MQADAIKYGAVNGFPVTVATARLHGLLYTSALILHNKYTPC
jgi:hypothetical protein